MKKITCLLLSLLPLFAFFSCEDKEELVFGHEKPQFELKSDAILVEVIVPVETTITDEIYIIGDFNGGTAAAGKPEWKLQRSENTNYRWGVYVNPALFINGKTLADGYYFTSLQQGNEITLEGQDVIRHETGNAGSRLEGRIIHWKAYFHSSDSLPLIPANKIMLKLTVPDYTPENSKIALYGNMNGWDGADAKWQATMFSPTLYYVLLDPADFAAGVDLSQGFKAALIQPKKDWSYHQANADGGSDDGDPFEIRNIVTGNAYDITIAGWRNKDEIGAAEPEAIVIRLKQVEGNWAEFAVYSWSSEGADKVEAFGGWPGTTLTPDDDGWYSITVPDSRPINMIINNKIGDQFNFISDPTASACYEVSTQPGNISFTAVDCPEEEEVGITLKWKQAKPVWTGMAIYAYDGSPAGDVFGGWPGKVVIPDANGWYSVTLPAGQNSGRVIWNNNNQGIQIEPGPQLVTVSTCYEIDTEALTWKIIDCE
jgi:hypothetical protein